MFTPEQKPADVEQIIEQALIMYFKQDPDYEQE